MNIECSHDPENLIPFIGDRFFSICDEDYGDGLYNHTNHPHTIRIMDCETECYVDVTCCFGIDETRKMAINMALLLNQEYKRIDET